MWKKGSRKVEFVELKRAEESEGLLRKPRSGYNTSRSSAKKNQSSKVVSARDTSSDSDESAEEVYFERDSPSKNHNSSSDSKMLRNSQSRPSFDNPNYEISATAINMGVGDEEGGSSSEGGNAGSPPLGNAEEYRRYSNHRLHDRHTNGCFRCLASIGRMACW